jgi:hypothetical protein
VESGIELAYGQEPDGQLFGCRSCNVTWFGFEDHCWVCGGGADGPVMAVPPNGSETWSPTRCADAADDEETAAILRRVTATA